MDLHLRFDGPAGLSRQVYRQVREAILAGRLRRGDRLPATRELAGRLSVSRNTVSLAYEWLLADGLISGRRGAGSFVAGEPLSGPVRLHGAALRQRAVWRELAPPAPRGTTPGFDFGVGQPDAALFPADAWRRLLARRLRSSSLDGGYGDPAGHHGLRTAIARHVAVSRGVRAEAQDVLVTNGAQGAFDLLARVLVEAGTCVAVEEPGYPPPRLLFQSCGARLAPVRVDSAGLEVAALPPDARLVYVTPSHQFPLGPPLSHARRLALLAWAERHDAVIVEDDYDGEFRFGGRPLETLQALDRSGRVVYVGSFSKSLLPTLRLGFLVTPPSLREALRAAAYVAGWHVQGPAQAALATFIADGLLARHLRKARRVYAARRERVLRLLRRDFARWLEPVPALAGLHVAARLRSGGLRREREIAERAAAAGVGLDRLSRYYAARPAQPGFVLGYGGIAQERVDEGLRRLRACFPRD